jgi:hypothetical protein
MVHILVKKSRFTMAVQKAGHVGAMGRAFYALLWGFTRETRNWLKINSVCLRRQFGSAALSPSAVGCLILLH